MSYPFSPGNRFQPFIYHGPDPRGFPDVMTPRQQVVIPAPVQPPVDTSNNYSMYVDKEDLLSAEDMMAQLKKNIALLERAFAEGDKLLTSIHLSSCDALYNGVKLYASQLGPPEFGDLFKK